MVAEVIIASNVKTLNRIFDYNIPEEMKVSVGSRILVPFGNGKHLEEGYVIGIKETSEFKIKDIQKVEEQEALSEENIELAKWMARRYFCNIADCIKLMLTPGTTSKKLENRVKEKTAQCVYLKKEVEEIEFLIETEKIKSDKHVRILKFLMDNEGITVPDLEILTDTSRAILKTLEKHGYIELVEKQMKRNPFIHKVIAPTEKLNLTEEQQNAYNEVEKSIVERKFEEFLLYGITGSGKTEVYLQLIESVIKREKTAIVLVPEISLTPQMVDRFLSRFGQKNIAVLHSRLSIGERYDEWNRIKKGEAKIIIGARSAIFAPVTDLGLIIIDEEHDSSYQSEMTPKYDAKEISKYLAMEKQIPLVLGSATPDLTTFYQAQKGEISLLTLLKRANQSNLPEVEVVDLRVELASGNRSMLSRKLYEKIAENIKKKKQTILFLNRRGFSTFIMCRDCGYVVKCKNCNIALTYHRRENRLKCHYCGYEQENVTVCPECGSKKIRYFGTGTQKLEEQIQQLFPQAKTIRMDIDTVNKKNSHEEILNKFKNENIDILIGTQMVVKGHHFPNVTLVGVIAADGNLNIDDYRAAERTFQILTQVAGRAGREKEKGNVIIQTYNPDHYSIECSQMQNYNTFYEKEISLRKQLKYPPFCDIMVIGISGEKQEKVIETSEKLYQFAKQLSQTKGMNLNMYQPMPSPIDRIKNRYRYRIILKGDFDEETINYIHEILNKYYTWKINDIRVSIDVNPNNML